MVYVEESKLFKSCLYSVFAFNNILTLSDFLTSQYLVYFLKPYSGNKLLTFVFGIVMLKEEVIRKYIIFNSKQIRFITALGEKVMFRKKSITKH